MSDSTRDFIICQIRESLENNDVLCLDDLTSRILLYNSLIALIVLPVEQAKRSGTGGEENPLFKKSLSDLRKACQFDLTVFEPIKWLDRDGDLSFGKKDIYRFMTKLRNSIAHQNIFFDEDEQLNHRITFFNRFGVSEEKAAKLSANSHKELNGRGLRLKNSHIEDFRITLTFEQLRTLANWIGEEYLRAMEYDPQD